MMHLKCAKFPLGLIVSIVLTACGTDEENVTGQQNLSAGDESFEITGAGVKGPLAFANVSIYALDTNLDGLYDPDKPIATATTNAYAEIKELRISKSRRPDRRPPYVLVIDGANAIDLNTNTVPVIEKLATIIGGPLDNKQPVYATPYTTLAYYRLLLDIPPSGSAASKRGTDPLLETRISDINKEVIQALGFGMPPEINIFTTSPIITDDTTSVAQQQHVVYYRAAIEALSSITNQMSLATNSQITTDVLIKNLVLDYYSDGTLDGTENGSPISGINIDTLIQNPMFLDIPNTDYLVNDTPSLIYEESALVGASTNILFYKDDISFILTPLNTLTNTLPQAENTAAVELEDPTNIDPVDTATTEPVDPSASEPSDPAASEPTDPSASEPSDPAASEPTDPTASEPTDPTASEPSDPANPVHDQFSYVPVLPGRMNFQWFPEAKSLYLSSQPDDPMNWPDVYGSAANVRTVNSCASLQAELNRANPGDMILVESGTYTSCNVTISRSGQQGLPIIITSRAKALGIAGEVTFNSGSIFGTTTNAASHYIIGGFNFTNQTDMAFKLPAGATGEAGSSNIRFTDNHFEGIGKNKGSNNGLFDIGVRCHNIRIDHSSFIANYTHIRYRNDIAHGSLLHTSKNGRVDHNYFGPAADTGFVDGVPYETGAIQTCCGHIKENSDPLTLTFEYNVVEHKKTKYSDHEIAEIKTSGMVIQNNIIWSDHNAAIELRYSFNSTVESNYLVGAGITVHGANHLVFNNVIDGVGRLKSGISMNRWGRRQPDNCTTIPPTRNNEILQNTILNTAQYGLRIGDCDYGACRPITDLNITSNFIKSSTGLLAHFNTKDEPGRTTACYDAQRSWMSDSPGDADGGINERVDFTANYYSRSGSASFGSAYTLDTEALTSETTSSTQPPGIGSSLIK